MCDQIIMRYIQRTKLRPW